jgi:prepilin-type N-terminal cleavage/methylation domain-containing protein
MYPLGRRGFTLIELLVAIVLLGIVVTGIYRVLVGNQRMYHAQTQQIELQQNIRAAATILPAEFREIAASEGDIYAMTATEIQMRALRQFGVMCREPTLGGGLPGLNLILFAGLFNGAPLVTGDSMLLYYEGDEGTRNDDSWWPALVQLVGATTCPDGSAGIALTADLAAATAGLVNRSGAIPRGGPIRGFVPVRYALYQSATDNLWYLGLELPRGSSIQPLVGPLSGSDGLLLRYFDANGVATADSSQVALIELHVRGRTAAPVQRGGAGGLVVPVDSLTTRVALRNNRRF